MRRNIPHLGPPAAVSVVVPVFHEAATINELIGHVKKQGAALDGAALEILVVDPQGDTLAALESRHGDVVGVQSLPGRARQMNAGAQAASGDIFLFLHADTHLPKGGLRLMVDTLAPAVAVARQGVAAEGLPEAGAFGLSFQEKSVVIRLFALGGELRNRLTHTPYGDQAQFFTARLFRELGGYPDIPLMEDVAIMRTLRRTGRKPVILPAKVRTSARRYTEQGVFYAGIRNNILRVLYGLGVPAEKMAGFYQRTRKRV